MAEKEGTWRAYFEGVMLKIQNSIHNIFAITEVTKDQKTYNKPNSNTISGCRGFFLQKKSHNSQNSVSQSQLV